MYRAIRVRDLWSCWALTVLVYFILASLNNHLPSLLQVSDPTRDVVDIIRAATFLGPVSFVMNEKVHWS